MEKLAAGPVSVFPSGGDPGSRPRTLLVGEVFNLPELAADAGVPLQEGPEAVLSAGFGRWGRDLLRRLHGSFATVLCGAEGDGALIAADRMAGHSIFFHRHGDRVAFASEIRSLLSLLPTRPGPDQVGLVHWLAGSRVPAGTTLYEKVRELLGGEHFELGAGGLTQGTHWEPRYDAPERLSFEDAAEALWDEIVHAVSLRMSLTEGAAIVMSSGIDSSIVAAAAADHARRSGARAHGLTAVFPRYSDPRVNEAERTRELVAALDLPTTFVAVEPGGAVAVSLDWLETWNLPLLGPGYVLEHALLALADDSTVVLDGQWGDETLGATANYLPADLLRRGRVQSSLRLSGRFPESETDWRSRLEQWYGYAVEPLVPLGLQRAVSSLRKPSGQAPGYLTDESADIYVSTNEFWAWKRRRGVPRWWAEKADLVTRVRQASSLGSYLRQRAALAGLAARPVFFDVGLIELALRLPPEFDFDPMLDRPLARRAMQGRVPDSVRLSTTKSDLTPFYRDTLWGSDLEVIRNLVLAREAEIRPYVRSAKLDAVLNASGPGAHLAAWRLFSAECWLRFQSDDSITSRLRQQGLSRLRAGVWRNA